jgi:hypothetical protein
MDESQNVEQLLDTCLVDDFSTAIDTLVEKCAAPARAIRLAVSSLYTQSDIGFYWSPTIEKVGIHVRPTINEQEFEQARTVLSVKLGSDRVLDFPLIGEDLDGWWVKVAYSPTLRRTGELLQFLPSKDIPGFGGRPIASAVASGLLGAGLGYGAGVVGERLLPESMKTKGTLRKRLATIGGLGGAAIGALPGLVNLHDGRSFNDATLWQGHPDDPWEGGNLSENYKNAVDQYVTKQADTVGSVGGPSFEQMPLVRMNDLGQVLWGTNANPQTTAMTMGAMYGASQMPDRTARPGYVTPHQTGLFGMAMGAAGGGIRGYLTGRSVGVGLGLLTGMPQKTQNVVTQSGLALGVINSLVPRLYN